MYDGVASQWAAAMIVSLNASLVIGAVGILAWPRVRRCWSRGSSKVPRSKSTHAISIPMVSTSDHAEATRASAGGGPAVRPDAASIAAEGGSEHDFALV